MEKRTRSTRLSIRFTAFLILIFSFPLQTSIASEASKTIIGVDLGMSRENLETGKRLLVSILKQADPEEHYGLVIADEMVRTIVDPMPAKELLATFSDISLNPSDTGNFSTLLERSLAMDDKSAVDSTRLWFISSGEIKLTENEDTAAKQERYQMWASTILLPDIATRYEGFRMITPEQNNKEMVDTVIGFFGNDSHKMLPDEQTDVAQFVDSLTSDVPTTAASDTIVADHTDDKAEITTDAVLSEEAVVAAEPVAAIAPVAVLEPIADGSTPVTDTKIETAILAEHPSLEQQDQSEPEQTTTADPQRPLQPQIATDDTAPIASSTSDQTDEPDSGEIVAVTTDPVEQAAQLPIELATEPTDIQVKADVKQQTPAVTNSQTQVASIDTDSSNISTVAATVTEQATVGTVRSQTNQIAESTSSATTSDPELADTTAGESGTDKIGSKVLLAILAAITALVIMLTSIYRRRSKQPRVRKDDLAINSAATGEFETLPDPLSTSEPAALRPTVETNTPPESHEAQEETVVVTNPQSSPATVVTQASSTDATVVNSTNHSQDNVIVPNSIVDDFSAFDRIIEKRSAKQKNKKLEDQK